MAQMDIVRLVNTAPTPFIAKWDNQTWTIKSGSESLVPRDAANLWFGDGSLVDAGNRRDRSIAYDRLRSRYGAYERDEVWETNKPCVELYDLDGERIHTIIDDPDGDLYGPVMTQQNINTDLESQLSDMQRQMAAIERALADRDNATASTVPGAGATEGSSRDVADPDVEDASENDLSPSVEEDTPIKPATGSKSSGRVRGGN